MAKPVKYKKQVVNLVAIAIVLGLAALGYLTWVYLPLKLRESEVVRILDETSSEFLGASARFLEVREEQQRLLRKMRSAMQEAGIQDPNAEYWIEIDNDNQVRFGVLYADVVKLVMLEPREKLHELEMLCTRPVRGSAWTCEARDLLQESGDALAESP